MRRDGLPPDLASLAIDRQARVNWQAALSLIVLLALVIVSLLAPWIARFGPLEAGDGLRPPSPDHLLGTDQIGRDVFSRMLYGGRLTLGIAALAMLVVIIPGAGIGIIAGYGGGLVDQILMLLLDALLAFPALLLALTILEIAGRGPLQIAAAVGIAGMPAYARVIRARARELRASLFVEASYAIGGSTSWILTRHLIPNMLRTLLAFGMVALSWAILNAAMLAFLGFGGDPSSPEWGTMLAAARQVFRLAPWTAIAPGLAIMLTLLCANLFADAIAQAPKD